MMSHPRALAEFIERLKNIDNENETIELVIAGDFLDFLAIEPTASFTPDPNMAKSKLMKTMHEPQFNPVFKELGRLLYSGHEVTVLVGNHDIEFSMPPVQDALIEYLNTTPLNLRFVDDGRAYRIGRALIEHGNRYDNSNTNDWTHIRAMASALSRYESPPQGVEVSAGSRLVNNVINPIKKQYPFIDLLQPQNELVALLLIAFEPGLIFHLNQLSQILHARFLAESNKYGTQPAKTSSVSYKPEEIEYDTALADAFPTGVYEALYRPTEHVSALDLVTIAWQARSDSLVEILKKREPVPKERLHQIRIVMQKLLLDDDSSNINGDTVQYGKAAKRIIKASKGAIDVVLMGHTHLARSVGPNERATYINTGTWADIVRVPSSALTVTEDAACADEALTEFLRDLLRDRRPNISFPYAELLLNSDGVVIRNELKWQI